VDAATTRRHGDPRRATTSASITRSLADIERVRGLAETADRPDLVERLDNSRARLVADDVPVAVVGEFKQGKSTLVNALLRTEVCPVDTDIVTAVPTIIRYGAAPRVVAQFEADGSPAEIDVPFDRLRDYVTEQAASGRPVKAVEVRLDRVALRGGLTLIDTPGVGGLDSAQGNLTLGALPLARAALFVTDAIQELTAPELEFLTRTVDRCPTVVCVVTKIDLHEEWRRIVEINRGHLSRVGLSLPVVPVSSFLRLRAGARHSDALNAESGFPALLEILRRNVLDSADDVAVRAATRDVGFVLAQLRDQVAAERTAVHHPEAGAALVDTLTERARRNHDLVGASASWQRVLSDGIQDLSVEVDHDLRARMRSLVRRGEALLDDADPKDTWKDFEAWLAREASAAAVDNLLVLVSGTENLAQDVAQRFDLEYERIEFDLPAPTASLAQVDNPSARFERSTARQFLSAFTTARLTVGGLVMFGAISGLIGMSLAPLAPIGALIGVAVGRRLIRDERERQVETRRHQAKQELRRYVDEVAFVVGKDSHDAVRRAQRFLRDEFAARAAVTERSSRRALVAVQRSLELPESERERRAETIEAQWRDLDRAAEQVSATAAGPGPRQP
jgi:hypothetical protein